VGEDRNGSSRGRSSERPGVDRPHSCGRGSDRSDSERPASERRDFERPAAGAQGSHGSVPPISERRGSGAASERRGSHRPAHGAGRRPGRERRLRLTAVLVLVGVMVVIAIVGLQASGWESASGAGRAVPFSLLPLDGSALTATTAPATTSPTGTTSTTTATTTTTIAAMWSGTPQPGEAASPAAVPVAAVGPSGPR